MFSRLMPLVAALGLYLLSNPAHAQFWDQGFDSNLTRTPYNVISDGTNANPITYETPCIWSFPPINTPNGCPPERPDTVDAFGDVSNAYWIGSFLNPVYWVLDMNNEPIAFNDCNSGPPHLSLPRSEPGSGIMGYTVITDTEGGEDFPRAHLVLNVTFLNPCRNTGMVQEGTMPFLSIGASDIRGNNNVPPGQLNTGIYNRVQFTAKIWTFNRPSCDTPDCFTPEDEHIDGGAMMRLYAVAEWFSEAEGKVVQRMLNVNLFHWNIDDGAKEANYAWNWPIPKHYFDPGTDLAYFDAEAVLPNCGYNVPRLEDAPGLDEITYDIDLQRLFECADDLGFWETPMPRGQQLDIVGVFWANEVFGVSGALWTSVDGMTMVPAVASDPGDPTSGDDDDDDEDDDDDDD